MDLSPSQQHALQKLQGTGNIFLTGVAGSGKSFLVNHYLRGLTDSKKTPVLASTGAAALLVGGRTFHSFFGLGIMEGGITGTVERATRNQKLCKRLYTTDAVVIDEVSMISGTVLKTAEAIARKARGGTRPWGGLRVIAVGDFAQLPPVSLHRTAEQGRDWAFLDEIWEQSEFEAVVLPETLRTSEPDLLHALNGVRLGKLDPRTVRFLNEHSRKPPRDFDGTRLFGRRAETEKFNLERLESLTTPAHSFYTIYTGKEKQLEDLKKNAPVPEVLKLKEGALVMLRQNDVEGKWVNGSVGTITAIKPEYLKIELANGRDIEVEKATFTMLDAEGSPVASATNFPLNLAYAMTVHKAQGATLDQMQVDLKSLWEPGQAYVALSRARSATELYIEGWSASSIRTDPRVTAFHEGIGAK